MTLFIYLFFIEKEILLEEKIIYKKKIRNPHVDTHQKKKKKKKKTNPRPKGISHVTKACQSTLVIVTLFNTLKCVSILSSL